VLLSLIAVSVVLAAWALGAARLERLRLTAPMILVLAGVGVGFTTQDVLAASLNTDTAQAYRRNHLGRTAFRRCCRHSRRIIRP
jgi:hypothetical protein